MTDAKKREWMRVERKELVDTARTTVAAVLSLLVGRALRLPEGYWSAIATIIVMQSTLGAAWTISKERLIGTAFGAGTGAVLATYTGQNLAAFGAGVFAMGVLCAMVRAGQGAYRYAGITLVIVMMIPHANSAWMVALHRFIEISIGIAVGLLVTAVWPEPETAAA